MGRVWGSTLEVRTPLKRTGFKRGRGGALRRSWLRAKSPRRIGRQTEAETFHKQAIRAMGVCAVLGCAGVGRCRGPLQAAHLGPSGGTSAKHGDWTCATMMCRSHHDQIDGRQKPSVFDAMPAEAVAQLKDDLIHLAREFVAGRRTVSL